MDKKILIKNILLTVVYAIFTLFIVLHHEIWADEAQVWVLCRDCSLFELIKLVRIEGHPLLWYFLVFPFAKILQFPNAVMSMQILNWFFVVLAAGFFVFKSPFGYILKISFLMSAGFLYWYPCIARSYCLIPILMFLLAYYYPKQEKHPYKYAVTLGLLANTHVIMFGFSSILAVIFFIINKQNLISKTVLSLMLLFVPLYLLTSISDNSVVKLSTYNFYDVFQDVLTNVLGTNFILFIILFVIFLVCSLILFFKKDKFVFAIVAGSLLYQFLIYIFIWRTLPQRAFIIILSIIYGLWIVYRKNDLLKFENIIEKLLIAILTISMFSGYFLIKNDLYSDFSGGKKMAEYIRKNIDKNAIFISVYPLITPSVSAYLPNNKNDWKIYYAGYHDFYTYTHWNEEINFVNSNEDREKFLNTQNDVYIIMCINKYISNLKPDFKSDGKYRNENFKIYKTPD